MRILLIVLVVMIAALQYKAWRSDVGFDAAAKLRAQLDEETARAAALRDQNRRLTAEVMAFNHGEDNGFAAVEARARIDLGMVRQGEKLFLFPETP